MLEGGSNVANAFGELGIPFEKVGAAGDAAPGSGAALYADKPRATDDPYRYLRW